MSSTDQPPQTVVGMASRLSDSLLRTLPPAFVLLVLLNCVFLGLVMWFISSEQGQRDALYGKVVDRCMEIALQHAPEK
jgi:hypothetical protein